MKAPLRKVKSWMPDTVTFGRVFFFLHAYTTSDLRTFRRTCIHVRKECSLEISVDTWSVLLWKSLSGKLTCVTFPFLWRNATFLAFEWCVVHWHASLSPVATQKWWSSFFPFSRDDALVQESVRYWFRCPRLLNENVKKVRRFMREGQATLCWDLLSSALSFTFSFLLVTAVHVHVLKAGPLEAILVIFGGRALIFLFESSWKKWKMTSLLCACAVVITLETQKCRKMAPRSVEFNFFNNCDRKKRFSQIKRRRADLQNCCLRFFNFCLGT